MFRQLFINKRFMPLLESHLLSSVNDSFIRSVFLFFVTYQMTKPSPFLFLSAFILYAFCFCLGSVFAGQVADKVSKKKFLIGWRLIEVGIMALALMSLFLDSRWLLTFILALMGFSGAGLRVANYALVPQLMRPNQFNVANALLKMTTVLGAAGAAILMTFMLKWSVAYQIVLALGIVLSLLGVFLACRLPDTPPVDPQCQIERNPIKVFDFTANVLKHQFDRWAYLVGIAWFWAVAVVVLLSSGEYVHSIMHARWSVVLFLSAGVFAIGYIGGSLMCGHFSKKKALGSYTPLVGLVLSFVMLDLVCAGQTMLGMPLENISVAKLFSHVATVRVVFDTGLLGLATALYLIPLYTLVQLTTNEKIMGRMMAFSSLLNAQVVLVALLIILSCHFLGFSVLDVLTLFAVANVFVSIYMVRLLPKEMRRKIFKFVLKTVFSVELHGLENLEKAGKRALIITNHTSYLDVLLISTFIEKPIVFTVSDRLIDKTVVKFMTTLVDVRPLDPTSPFAVKDMAEELKKDQLCMIFMEGLIEGGNTRMKIYEGPAMMAVKGEAPVLPIRIDGASHALFSRVLGKKADFRWLPKITLNILPPVFFNDLSEELTTRERREQSSSRLYDIVSDMSFDMTEKNIPLFRALAHAMRMAGRFKPVLEDTERKPQKFWVVFMKSFILGRLIQRAVPDDPFVGVMIPTSNTCALTFLGLHAFGKVPAMINFTSGPKQVVATCKTIGLKTIVTAKKVVLLAKLENLVAEVEKEGVRVVYLEDLKPTLTTKDKLLGIVGGFFPSALYRRTRGKKIHAEDPAVVLFTSGSEGMPKAVFLTHHNLLSNCYQIPSRLDVLPTDVFLNCLPMFHSFGLGAGTILPLLMGVKTVLYPTPLHYRIIPEIAAATKATIFFGTDTFLAGYAKCANPYDFNSLRIVAAGAEKVKDETRKIWSEKFGVRILEGYGATECSPFISVNTFLHQRKDSVGRFLPGIEYRLKPVEGIKEGAELWVKGPNIMKGYMRYDKPLQLDPPKDGWYDTGDIVHVDKERYIFIKGRCKRFAKIGGEMVSLLAVEMVIEKNWPGFISGAVSVPDAKKGEQIILITTAKTITKEGLCAAFKQAGITELGLPSRIITTETPPLLGTGKFDYVSAKEMALKEIQAV